MCVSYPGLARMETPGQPIPSDRTYLQHLFVIIFRKEDFVDGLVGRSGDVFRVTCATRVDRTTCTGEYPISH